MHVFIMTLILFKNKKHLPSGICYGKTLKINNFLKREKEERYVTEPLKPQKSCGIVFGRK